MKHFFLFSTLFSFLFSQTIFDSFEQERKNRYRYTEKYEFDDVLNDGKYTVIVKNFIGDMTLKGHSDRGLSAEIQTTIKTNSEKKAKKVIHKYQILVQHDSSENIIQIIGPKNQPGRMTFDLALNIPIMTNLQMKSLGGDITGEKLQGELELITAGGDIDLKQINGKGLFKTAGGNIDFKDGEGRFTVLTKGGDVKLKYIEGKLLAKTAGGDINLSRIVGNAEVSTLGGLIGISNFEGNYLSASTMGGDIHIRDINGNTKLQSSGGELGIQNLTGNVVAKTASGDIELDEVYGLIDCSTTGGNIYGENIYGGIRAVNQAGDISIEKKYDKKIKDHSIDLKSLVGNVKLTLPENFSTSILLYHSGWDGQNPIDSNFELDRITEDGYLKAKATLFEGLYSCKIQIGESGNIQINKD